MFKKIFLKSKKGQSTVEFAIIAPILVMLVFASLQMGLILHDYITIAHLAREGARYAAVHYQRDSDISNYIKNNAPPHIKKSALTIFITPPENSSDRVPGNAINVHIRYNISHRFFLPHSFFGIQFPNELPQLKATMVIE
jgi:Flp pilus assembly protein TadG